MKSTSRLLPPLLGFLTAVGPLSTDMYLPAFPAIEASYGAPEGTAQITLASWFAGLAVGQITQGTLSDRFGRRAPLIAGLVIYTLASAGCALAPSLTALTILRAIGAFGGSASLVLPRAMVRDLADGHAAARLMSQLMLVMGVAPILAPTLGGFLLAVANWQVIFWFATVHGAISLLIVIFVLPETLPAERRVKLGLVGLVSRYGTILRERTFFLYMSIGACVMFSMFAYLSGSPPVYIQLFDLSPPVYGMLFGICAAGYILGAQINPFFLRRFGASRVLRVAVRLFLASTIALVICAFAGPFGVLSVFVPIFLGMCTLGFIQPNTAVGALSPHPTRAGSASALMGTIQFILAAISGSLMGVLADGTAGPMALAMLLGAVCATVIDLYRRS
ncbi:multidrug effflux MFS transporter [Acidisphaera sp. L21]|uniref:multidrug effflux MFS transporter n=1 Tax=Acidisphaera sp. L21 TaxID=1641851 RepID=UPI00131E1DD9|nr:multidrug effflux MFS transporter [Acidisphaera sp. L21]